MDRLKVIKTATVAVEIEMLCFLIGVNPPFELLEYPNGSILVLVLLL